MASLIATFSLVLILLSGCAPVVILGGAAGAGATLSKNKTVGSSLDDTNIWTKIKADFLSHNKTIPGIMTDVSVEVSEGRVLLTGSVDSAENRLKILQIVWEQRGVKEVINELKVKGVDETGEGYYANDALITAKIKTRLLMHKEIRSINYNVETIKSIVYILGVAGSEQELYQVIHEAETVPNVQKVITYIKVKTLHEVSGSEASSEGAADQQDTNNEQQKIQHEEKNIQQEEEPKTSISSSPKKKVEYIEIESDEENEIEIGQESD